jgi:hypothetical protein
LFISSTVGLSISIIGGGGGESCPLPIKTGVSSLTSGSIFSFGSSTRGGISIGTGGGVTSGSIGKFCVFGSV